MHALRRDLKKTPDPVHNVSTPMILLSVREVARQFDADPVFERLSFEVRPGEKIGLVGTNGAGKTTLLNLIAGKDEPDAGRVEHHTTCRIAYLEQEDGFDSERSLLDEAKSGLAPLYGLQAEAEEMASLIATETDPVAHDRWQRRYDKVQQELHRLSAYNIDHRVDEVLAGLGFTRDQYDRPLKTFSGGQQNRVLLARLLLAAPDVMLLDEPTNHLDIGATEWLENYLAACPQAMIVVSHDRYFLDKVTNRILELNAGAITDYPGNFSAYWKLREERAAVVERSFEKQQEYIARQEEFIRRNFYSNAKQSHDRERKLERLERVELMDDLATSLHMTFGEPRRAGEWVVEATGLTKGFRSGEPLFTDVSLQVLRGDRIGIFGPNGSGKTTLLRTLLGELQPDAGTVRFGTNVDVAYFDQQLDSVDPDCDLIEAVRPPSRGGATGSASATRPETTPAWIRSLLGRFGLRGDIVFQRVGNLSGGEKSKVALARLAALNANVLVLDEPTNHLDLWARDALETALGAFEGTMLFVSHDRYFLDRVATKLIALEPTRWRLYDGNYSAYVDSLRRAREEASATEAKRIEIEARRATASQTDQQADSTRRRRKFPYRKVHDLEADIHAVESRLAQIESDLANPDMYRDGQKARLATQEFEDLRARLTQLYEHWEEAVELN